MSKLAITILVDCTVGDRDFTAGETVTVKRFQGRGMIGNRQARPATSTPEPKPTKKKTARKKRN